MDMKLNKEKLKTLRESKAWSQSHLSEVSGISLRTIQRIEKSGIASPESVKSLCATFSIEIGDIALSKSHDRNAELTFSNVIRHKVSAINKRAIFVSFLLAFTIAFVTTYSFAAKDDLAPTVIETFPINGSMEVDPSITEITVTFSTEMRDNSWSWADTAKGKFPQTSGIPSYSENNTKNSLPVKLEPNKEYEIWINSQRFGNFKDKSGNSAPPYKLTFRTR